MIEFKYPDHAIDDGNITFVFDVFSYSFRSIAKNWQLGTIDEEVKTYLESSVVLHPIPSEQVNDNFKFGKLSIIVSINKKRDAINEEMLNKLLPQENIYYVTATDRDTNFRKETNIDKQESKKDENQLSPTWLLKRHAPIIITSNHSEAKYRLDGINNGAKI